MKSGQVYSLVGGLALALLFMVFVPAGAQSSGGGFSSAYHKISAAEAKALLDEGGVVVVDVRRADEYETGHIPGAVNIPNEEITDRRPGALPDLDATVLVYCRTGVRSREASDKLVGMGFRNVYDLGGIVDWPYYTVTGREPGAYLPAGAGLQDGERSLPADYYLPRESLRGPFCCWRLR